MKDHFEAPKLIPPTLAGLSTVGMCKFAIYVQALFLKAVAMSQAMGHATKEALQVVEARGSLTCHGQRSAFWMDMFREEMSQMSEPHWSIAHVPDLSIVMKFDEHTICSSLCCSRAGVWQAAEAKRKQEEALKLLRKEIEKVAIQEQQLQEAAWRLCSFSILLGIATF